MATYLFIIPGETRPLACVVLYMVNRDEAVLRPPRPLTSALLRPGDSTDLCSAEGGARLLTSAVLKAGLGY